MRSYMRMFFDTETTDFWNFDKPAVDPSQPMLAQIAWVLDDDSGRTVSVCSALISQHQWCTPESSAKYRPRVCITERCEAVHHITNDMIDRYGQGPDLVIMHFLRDLSRADEVVAHNISFDIGVMDSVVNVQHLPSITWPRTYCTKERSTPICQIPGRMGGYKWPNLGEAYQYFTKKRLSGAHDALVDVYGCRTVYRGIEGMRAKEEAA